MNLNHRVENSMRNAIVGVIAQFVQVISSFLCRMIFVRCLAQEYLGVNGLFSNILTILAMAELGIGSAITFELYRALADNDEYELSALMALYRKAYTIIGLIIGVAGLVVLPFVGLLISKDTAITESLYLLYLLYLLDTVVSYFFSYRGTIIDASQQNYILTLLDTGTGIVRNILQCVALLITRNFLLYLLIQIAFKLIYNLLVSYTAAKFFPILKEKNNYTLPKEKRNRIFQNVKCVFITNIFARLVGSTDNIIITALDGLAVTGINSNYSLIISTLITFTTKIQSGITASVGNISAVETKEKKLSTFYEVFAIYFWMYFWCGICFAILVQPTISLVFGGNYVMAFNIGIITGMNFVQSETSTAIGAYKSTMGLFRYGKFISIFTSSLNIILSIILGQKYGVFGILLATFISRMLTTEWYIPYVTFKYGFESNVMPYYRKMIIFWLEGMVIFGITYFICTLLNLSTFPSLIYRMFICLIVPNALWAIIHHKDDEYARIKTKLGRYFRYKLKKSD